MTSTQARTASKTTKRPERPHGGVLCSVCSRRVIVSNMRMEAKQEEAPNTAEYGGDIQ